MGIAVGLSGFAFGVTSAGAGLSLLQTCALSLFVFTGASQFALVGALAAGGNPLTAAAGAFFLGIRNAFYGLRLSAAPRRCPASCAPSPPTGSSTRRPPSPWRSPTGAPPASASPSPGSPSTSCGTSPRWSARSGAEALGDTDAWGLDAAGPAVFLALLAPMLKSTTERVTAGLAVLLAWASCRVLPAGVPVLVAALAAPLVLFLKGRGGTTTDDTTTEGTKPGEGR